MNPLFTSTELTLLLRRLNGAVTGLAREMNYRCHPLTPPAARDQRFNDIELVQLYRHYQQLGRLAQQLFRPAAPFADPPPLHLSGDMLLFLADELALTHSAAAYVHRTPFSRHMRHKLLRALAVEARFFQLLLDEAAREARQSQFPAL